MRDALLVAIGAVPGAWLRFRLVNHFEPMVPRKHWATFGVNVSACFALGLISALERSCGAHPPLALLLGVGFLGSFSTFSSFVAELRTVLAAGHWREAALLVCGSLSGGLLAMAAGISLGGKP